jgi:hypothetical protein
MRKEHDARDSKETAQTSLFRNWSQEADNSVIEESSPSQDGDQSKDSEQESQSQNAKLDDFM